MPNHATGIPGVVRTRYGTYSTKVYHHGKHFHLGTFKTPEEAKEVYEKARAHLQLGATRSTASGPQRQNYLQRLMDKFPAPSSDLVELGQAETQRAPRTNTHTLRLTLAITSTEPNGIEISDGFEKTITLGPDGKFHWAEENNGAPIPQDVTVSNSPQRKSRQLSKDEKVKRNQLNIEI